MDATKHVAKNLKFILASELILAALKFASRRVFVFTLGKAYLGLNGLFSDILSALSLAELGFGVSITYSLYRPVAQGDTELIKSLVRLYRRVYRTVGAAVLAAGLALSPFLNFFVKEMPGDIPSIPLIYALTVVNTGISYFWSYKSTLLFVYQKKYIDATVRTVVALFATGAQIAVLLLTRNFFLYLLVQILCGLLPNILASRRAERMYPYLREDRRSYPDRETAREIFRNVRALFIHKAAGMMVYSVDSILISALVSLGTAGIYSNYKLICTNVGGVVDRLYDAVSASIGNLVATEGDEDRRHRVFSMLSFSAFLLYSACAVAMLVLFEPFILLCFGGDYLLPRRTVLLLLAQFYITGMRTVIQKFRGAMGLFWYDRYKALAEVAVNLVFSLVLARRFGLDGILAATVLDLLLIPFWVDPLVLFRYGWRERRGQRLAGYFLRYLLWTGGMLLAGWGTERVCRLAGGPGFWNLAAKGLTCAVLYGGMLLVLFGWTPECRDLLAYVGSFVRRTRPRAGKV